MDIRPSFMATTGGEALPLQDVAIDATLRDLMAEASVTHVYRNDARTNIEAVYTFPLPLDYQLVSKWTNFLVVAERAEGEKAKHLPELQKVIQTLAAGWGGRGRWQTS